MNHIVMVMTSYGLPQLGYVTYDKPCINTIYNIHICSYTINNNYVLTMISYTSTSTSLHSALSARHASTAKPILENNKVSNLFDPY